MVIQHNIMALNSYNRLGTNNSLLSKNLEKLSSGYQINRAGDNAAGLAISEKMRAQITGLEKATANAQDAISLVQTAEGAMTEIHSMLNRMVELATQSANGTYEDGTNRTFLQDELEELKLEINRIAEHTNFNGIKLFDGNFDESFQVGPAAAEAIGVSISNMNWDSIIAAAGGDIDVSTLSKANASIDAINQAIDFVSAERSNLGAKQNRLEHTINNLTTTTENLTASESRIRDTDMAKEMMAYTKNNVLAQAAQAMLAQANQQPQMVLQLLQ